MKINDTNERWWYWTILSKTSKTYPDNLVSRSLQKLNTWQASSFAYNGLFRFWIQEKIERVQCTLPCCLQNTTTSKNCTGWHFMLSHVLFNLANQYLGRVIGDPMKFLEPRKVESDRSWRFRAHANSRKSFLFSTVVGALLSYLAYVSKSGSPATNKHFSSVTKWIEFHLF